MPTEFAAPDAHAVTGTAARATRVNRIDARMMLFMTVLLSLTSECFGGRFLSSSALIYTRGAGRQIGSSAENIGLLWESGWRPVGSRRR